ncbi:MAG TPA: BadF/BadG/BcrA/BcrD ATPase family protein [Candidatus Hydrogenedentes bacterium]|nr:BadF/BadG/BcrA/BcrD ATPase family protein [Candidatus Hydrogenedentota bacterium]HOL76858.1 BadF/BadG/BcrA/BcrD ATPase family protein [Candidatus Hydrogenedentota bacterium]HPO85509.1 BadF/BadG/BcrA/BcrD ATPase family protein [Candidatus Hydrogenedentota bacterium]
MIEELWIAFEGGGTKTRVLLAKPSGEVLAREVGTSASPLYIHPEKFTQDISLLLQRLRDVADQYQACVTTAALTAPMDVTLVESLLRQFFPQVHIFRFREGEAALSTYDLRAGCALIAGTGSSCYVIEENGNCVMSGGLGPQFGDEGSAYWISREAIAYALRTALNKRTPTRLEQRLLNYFEIDVPYEVFGLCRGNGFIPAPRVAGFAKEVFDLAEMGDEVACDICRRAGIALGNLVSDAVSRSNFVGRPFPLVLAGGVFHAGKWVIQPLENTLQKNATIYSLYPPVTEPAEGLIKALRYKLLHEGGARVS